MNRQRHAKSTKETKRQALINYTEHRLIKTNPYETGVVTGYIEP